MKRNTIKLILKIKFYVLSIIYLILQHMETVCYDVINNLKSRLTVTVSMSKASLVGLVIRAVKIPFQVSYFLYLAPIVFVFNAFIAFATFLLRECSRHSRHVNAFNECLSSLHVASEKVLHEVLSSKLSEFIPFCVNVILEVSSNC